MIILPLETFPFCPRGLRNSYACAIFRFSIQRAKKNVDKTFLKILDFRYFNVQRLVSVRWFDGNSGRKLWRSRAETRIRKLTFFLTRVYSVNLFRKLHTSVYGKGSKTKNFRKTVKRKSLRLCRGFSARSSSSQRPYGREGRVLWTQSSRKSRFLKTGGLTPYRDAFTRSSYGHLRREKTLKNTLA